MEGYYPVRLIDTSNPKGGAWISAWQHVKDGLQVKVCDDNGLEIKPPDVHEVHVVTADLHFAPAVLTDPTSVTYTPPPISHFVAALNAGPQAYAAFVKDAQHRKAAADAYDALKSAPQTLIAPTPEVTATLAAVEVPAAPAVITPAP